MNNHYYWNKYNQDKGKFDEWVKNNLADFQNALYSLEFSDDETFIQLETAINYALLGGKRVRPLLCIAAGSLIGVSYQVNNLVAITIEIIHIFSLCQDDLPSMDNDNLRHGKLSLHQKYGTTTTLLVCDALIAKAFSILSTLPLNDHKKILLIQELACTIGVNGMTGGQYLDLNCKKTNVSVSVVEYISYLKTTRLIQASLKMGILCCPDINNENIKKYTDVLNEYGHSIGQAYQIIDDILDYCATKEQLGKTPGKDLRDNKATSTSLIGIENSVHKVETLIDNAIKGVQTLGEQSFSLIGLALSIIDKLLIIKNYHDPKN